MDPNLLARRRFARSSLENFNSEEESSSRPASPKKNQGSLADKIRKPHALKKTKVKEKLKKLKPHRSRSEKGKEKQIRRPMFASTKSLQTKTSLKIGSERVANFKTAEQSEFILKCKDELKHVDYRRTGRPVVLFHHDAPSASSVNRYFANEIGMNTEQLIRCIEPVLQKHAKALESDAALFSGIDSHDLFSKEIVSSLKEWLITLSPSNKMASALGAIFQQIDANAAEESQKSPGLIYQEHIVRNAKDAKYSAILGLLVSPVVSKLLEYLGQKHPDTPRTNKGFAEMINHMCRDWEYTPHEFYTAGIGGAMSFISDTQETVKKKFRNLVEQLGPIMDRSSTELSSEDDALPQEVESAVGKIKFSQDKTSLKPIEKLKETYYAFPEAAKNIDTLSSSFEPLVSGVEGLEYKERNLEDHQSFEDDALSAGRKWFESLVIDPKTRITIQELLKTVDQKSETSLKETPDDRRSIEENAVRVKYAIIHALIIEPRLEEFSFQLEARINSQELRSKIDRTLHFMFTPEFIPHHIEVAEMQAYERNAYNENRFVRDKLMAQFEG